MRRRGRAAAAMLAVALAGVAAPAVAAPFDSDRAPGRLPKDVVPVDYRVAVVPDMDAMSIAGSESVTLRVRSPTGTIVFNSLNQRLSDVRLDGTAVAAVDSDDQKQLTTVTLAAADRKSVV